MAKIVSSMEEMVEGTPLVRLSRIEKMYSLSLRLLAKVEFVNPTGSVKDRAVRAMLDDAERRGLLISGGVVIEATSGNTGIGIAAFCAVRGYRAILVMPENMSRERQMLMRAYGAEVVLTPATEGMKGAVRVAQALHEEISGSFIPSQFDNPQNEMAHYEGTGREIYADTEGDVDIFVGGVGSGGTLMGAGRYLKERKRDIILVAVEPQGSAILSGQTKGEHSIQGIGAGFMPPLVDMEWIDEVIGVTDREAYAMQRTLAEREGLFCGISSGAALAAALTLARRQENEGKSIVTLLADTGERYLSDFGGMYDN